MSVMPAIRAERAPPRLDGLVDLVLAAMRVALWNWRDRWRCLKLARLVLPRPAPSVLRLPAR
jgi:hypothetical protein